MTVIPLQRRPAYTPLDPPATCMTPGHEDREARCYPGGRLCKACLPKTGTQDQQQRREERR